MHRVHFVLDRQFLLSPALYETGSLGDPEVAWPDDAGAPTWINRTFFHLRDAGLEATISDRCEPDAINVSHYDYPGLRGRPHDTFQVIIRADRGAPFRADYVIRQRRADVTGARWAGVTHWPQRGIRPRDPARGTAIEVVGYKGRLANLDERFRTDAFHDALASRGMSLRIETDGGPGAAGWADYRDTDLVLAARNLTASDAEEKPASKLVNAWLADVPALLGPEPAFRDLARGPLDYVEIRQPEEVLEAIDALRAEPDRYRAMQENGRIRRAELSEERIARRWMDILEGPVSDAFERWRRRPDIAKLGAWAAGSVLQVAARRYWLYRVHRGRRILDSGGPA